MRPLGAGLSLTDQSYARRGAGASILTGAARFLAKDLASRVVWGSNHRSRGIIAGDSDDREGNPGAASIICETNERRFGGPLGKVASRSRSG